MGMNNARATLPIPPVKAGPSIRSGGWVWDNRAGTPMRRNLEPQDALRLLGGGPLALVTTRWRTQTDVMPAIWTAPLSRTPPLVGVVVNPARHTHDMIRFGEEFALNFPGRDLMNHAHYFGAEVVG